MAASIQKLILYAFFSSSCTQRILISAALKKIELEYTPLNMRNKEHKSATLLAKNPSGALPVLEVIKTDGSSFVIAQSVAILEYFEEAFQDRRPLLPPLGDIEARARVRQLVGIMVSDAYPPSNSRISKQVSAIGGSEESGDAFVREVNRVAFSAYEKLLEQVGGEFSFGDEVTLADVCLVPQVTLAGFYGFRLEDEGFVRTKSVYERAMRLEEFGRSHWTRQVDTPESKREL